FAPLHFTMVVSTPPLASNKYKIFDQPFAHQLLHPQVDNYCSYCLRAPEESKKLLKCSACQFVQYCDQDCQKSAWSVHKHECRRLKQVFPYLPMTEVSFLSKVVDRVLCLSEKGDEHGWERERTFDSLLGHQDAIQKDEAKMAHFEKILSKMTVFRGDEMVSREVFFKIFCKVSINSHSIHSNAGIEIGMALDLGISKYNHSCRPTCAMVFDGIRVFFRPLIPEISIDDLDKAFISYVDVGRSRYRRRIDLKAKWYFDCECSRCSDPEDNKLTALRCTADDCDGMLITAEDEEPMCIACSSCGAVCDESRVKEAQELMKTLPASFDPKCPVETVEEYLSQARSLLHPSNVYITRLHTALLHLKGELDLSLPSLHKTIYDNYKVCFPKADRHVAYSLLNFVTSLIKSGKRKEAVLYAYEAMTILEVCLGLEHPFYLQSLALWTYLQNESKKTDEELISLTKYGDNKPVNISKLLEFTQPTFRSLTI
ncbi:hypothetical protein PFISCL1PPCAC_26267, partial [Pristionchus fissidentatus]